MINQIDNTVWHKANAVSRRMIVCGIRPLRQKVFLVNEYPKSGGSWMAQMLSEALNLPFPRNRFPMISDCILHGHYRPIGIRLPVVHVSRDGRDVITSFYFHRLVDNKFSSSRARRKVLKELGITDPGDLERNLPRFIEHVAETRTHPHISWSRFIEGWLEHSSVKALVKYECMLENSAFELQKVCDRLGHPISDIDSISIAKKFSFESLAKRKAGEENTAEYLRKGVAGDWKSKFNKESREVFAFYMGNTLVQLGYEIDNSWVDQ